MTATASIPTCCATSPLIAYTSSGAQRDGLKGPKFVSMDDQDEVTGAWKLADFVDAISADSSLRPDKAAANRESYQAMLDELAAKWQSSKSSRKVTDWSPADEIIGKADENDRPSEKQLPKRTRQRRQEEANDIVRKWLPRI